MATQRSLMNFKCPEDLKEQIEKIGKKLHPVGRGNKPFSLTDTLIDLIKAGIVAYNTDPSSLSKPVLGGISRAEIQSMIDESIAKHLNFTPKPESKTEVKPLTKPEPVKTTSKRQRKAPNGVNGLTHPQMAKLIGMSLSTVQKHKKTPIEFEGKFYVWKGAWVEDALTPTDN